MDEPIRLVPYDPAWPARYEAEAAVLRDRLGAWITGGVHHVGSTSVPGLAAKPIIDIAVGVTGLESTRGCIELLADLDYLYWPYRAEVMHWFCKPDPARRTHHLHLIPTGSARLADELAFRDYLRAHPDAAGRYAALKQELAVRYREDRDAYTDGKAAFVAEVTRAAHAWLAAGRADRVAGDVVPDD